MKKEKFLWLTLWVITPLLFSGAGEIDKKGSFTSFSVKAVSNNTVILQWETSGDFMQAYEVQRSSDNKRWETIASVSVTASNTYSYNDLVPTEGYNYYRVKGSDQNEQVVYSSIQMLRVKKKIKIFIWPNPSGNEINIQTAFQEGTIDVLDANGKTLAKKNIRAYITTFSTINYKPGIFYLRIQHGAEKYTEEFIKM